MGYKRSDSWETDYEVYTENQVEAVLEYCDIEVDSDTHTHFLAFCPFHGNTDTPALAVDKSKGLWTCFNPSCMNSGTLEELLRRRKKLNPFQAQRVILKYRNAQPKPISERLADALADPKQFPSMSQEKVAQLHEALWTSPALDYMRGRGLTDETLKYFQVGYSPPRILPAPYKSRPEMVVVPMHDVKGNPVGVVGRSIEGKIFKNSKNLPKSQTAWNIHRAKREGETVIICESTFDAMRIHQAGYPNVVALLGGHASPEILEQLNRHFSRIVIMSDFDKKRFPPNCRRCHGLPKCKGHRDGRDLGREIVRGLPNKKIMWAAYDDTCVYPHGAKDASDMTDDEIRQSLHNAISNLAYSRWDIEEKDDQLVA